MSQVKNVAIFGGTFDPIHFGHLLIAEQVINEFDLSRIIFMPAGLPPHKTNRNLESGSHRYNMVKLAIDNNENFILSGYELKKQGKSYTADTLRYFLKKESLNKIFFIIGADSLLDIFNWKEPDFLLNNSEFIVARRPGYDIDFFFEDEKYKLYRDTIHIMETLEVDFSSTRIRKWIQNEKSIKYQLPDIVIKYIYNNSLYRS
ncbi:MAG: nicotinate-nucleotide adenylyltransferase [Halanaerobiaceae bacterium]